MPLKRRRQAWIARMRFLERTVRHAACQIDRRRRRFTASLKKFDDWYFAFYPYLFTHIPFEEMRDKDVLEVGLGYGTVSQRIAESGARYQGLDIAAGPVSMANHRLRALGLAEGARQGNILKAPFAEVALTMSSRSDVCTIREISPPPSRVRRILRPGGKLIFMVYYAYSYRRSSKRRGRRCAIWRAKARAIAAPSERATASSAPPMTQIRRGSRTPYRLDFNSVAAPALPEIARLRSLARKHRQRLALPLGKAARGATQDAWPRWVGLDIYATATK